MADNRRALWLGGTLIAAIAAGMVVWSGSEPAPPPSAPRQRPPSTPRNATAAESADTGPVAVRLDALERWRNEPTTAGRDPFRFRPPPAPPPPPVTRPGGGLSGDGGFSSAPTTPPPPPGPPPITLKFIGLVQKSDGTRIAVLTDGKRPISGQEGEEIEGRYRIIKIDAESLEIAYLDGRGRTTLRLSGQ